MFAARQLRGSPGFRREVVLSRRAAGGAADLSCRGAGPSLTPKNHSTTATAFPVGGSMPASQSPRAAFFSTYTSFSEPDPSLFAVEPLSGSTGGAPSTIASDLELLDADYQLRKDIRMMGSLLGQVIRDHEEGQQIFQKVEEMRALAKRWREAGAGRCPDGSGSAAAAADAILEELAACASAFSDKELFLVSRAFTHFLALANAAESHHRTRRLKDGGAGAGAAGGLHSKPDSCGGVLPDLLDRGLSAEDVYAALTSQVTELVLTAHPTEVNRRTVLDKKRRIREILTAADACRSSVDSSASSSSSFDTAQLDDAIYREISSVWLSDEVSRFKPTPQTEAEKGVLVIETVLWEAVPRFLRKLDATVAEFLDGRRLPLDCAPIKFASWMGGDRDGNPNVRANTTREVCLQNRAKAASLFAADLTKIEGELSITTGSAELRSHVGDDAREPYRAFLRPIVDKMKRTEQWALDELSALRKCPDSYRPSNVSSDDVDAADAVYLTKGELVDELTLLHRSLCETGNERTADGALTDVIRNVSAFGLTLVPLDVRQESDRHEEAVDAVTRFLGLGSYSQWDEQTRIGWLTAQISSRRPLIRAGAWRDRPDIFSPTAVDTLETFQMVAEQPEDSLGAYVISQATSASDVLAVLLLQLDAGVKKPLRVVPLFETLDDLKGAADTMRSLFSLPAYMGIIQGKQEVMVGYSDSAKDAGRLAATWAQFETQEVLAKVAREHSVDMTFFHGKGGTVGRGGNPQTFLAILSHPPATINGKFRVTEQGEMIHQNFGFGDRAERTMDIYTAAVLAEKLVERPPPAQEWRDMMNTLSDVSCEAYRKVVRGDERFVPYFRSATPELELSALNIGSRPAKRKAGGGVESLRAIPWNFAWTQTRFNLPTWLGVGEALGGVLKSDQAPVLREMYREWGSFRTTVDLVEMVLSKSEPAIAKHYDDVLVSDANAKELGSELLGLLRDTEGAVLDLTDHTRLGENNHILSRALVVRNPYVDCLNVLQAETLKRIRKHEDGEAGKELKDALMTTITGVANGMGNTG